MASFSDLRLRFWITLAKRMIFLIDGALILITRLRPVAGASGTPLQSPTFPQAVNIPVRHGRLGARLSIPSHPLASVLICHGIGDRLSYWKSVQIQLAAFGMASLIFDYASYGQSTGSLSVQTLREDTQGAYAHLHAALPGIPVFLLGFSMGTGVAADAVPYLTPAPAGLILCQPFLSLRAAAAQIARSTLLSHLIPDVWNTCTSIATLSIPLLIVHGDADRLFPLRHAQTLYAAADPKKSALAIPPGFSHPGGYLNPTLTYWQPILNFIKQNMH